MVISRAYFKGEIYLPHANPSVSDAVLGKSDELDDFIEEYEREAILFSLGAKLGNEFINVLDPNTTNGLVSGADAKWDNLLNGEAYTNSDGEDKIWRAYASKRELRDSQTKAFWLTMSTSITNRTTISLAPMRDIKRRR